MKANDTPEVLIEIRAAELALVEEPSALEVEGWNARLDEDLIEAGWIAEGEVARLRGAERVQPEDSDLLLGTDSASPSLASQIAAVVATQRDDVQRTAWELVQLAAVVAIPDVQDAPSEGAA